MRLMLWALFGALGKESLGTNPPHEGPKDQVIVRLSSDSGDVA